MWGVCTKDTGPGDKRAGSDAGSSVGAMQGVVQGAMQGVAWEVMQMGGVLLPSPLLRGARVLKR